MATKRFTKNTPRREFQKGLTELKKAGLIPKSTDIRKVNQSRHYTALLNTYQHVVERKAVAAFVPTAQAEAALRERNHEIVKANKRTIALFPSSPNVPTRARVLKGGTVKVTRTMTAADSSKVRVTQEILPIKMEHAEQFFTDLKEQGYQLGPGQRVVFTLYGNLSRNSYSSFDDAYNKLVTYEVVQQALAGELTHENEMNLMTGIGFETTTMAAGAYARSRIADPKKARSIDARKQFMLTAKRYSK